jgi:hypothetical protein
MSQIIAAVFDVDPYEMQNMRLDFAADMIGIPVTHLYGSLRVKFKRSTDAIGESYYETVGSQQLQYFRYGKSPNCLRAYDKPAECMARYRNILKRSNPDAEPPTFEEVFGFPSDAIRARIERQSGGGRIPEQLSTFGNLYSAEDFNPFANIEIVPNSFPFPVAKLEGVANSLKLVGIHSFVERYGFQQARAELNVDRNAKRLFDDYQAYIEKSKPSAELTVESIVSSYRRSVARQIDGSIEGG